MSKQNWLVGIWLLAIVAFHLPWTNHPSAAFTLNGFDLAEQVSIHPGIRAETPPLRTAALLWVALPLLALGLATAAMRYEQAIVRWVLWGVAAGVALRVIPPESALRAPKTLFSEDYARTLFLLTLLGFMGLLGVVLGGRWWRRYMVFVETAIALLGLVLPLLGFMRAWGLLGDLRLAVGLGGGMPLYTLLLLAVVGTQFLRATPLKQGRPGKS